MIVQNNILFRPFCSYIAHELLLALDYLHTQLCPIIHHDVKTSNVLIRMLCKWRPDFVLSDFDASLELTTVGTLEPSLPRATPLDYAASGIKVCL